MFSLARTPTASKAEAHAQLLEQARALLHGERDRIANAANLASLVFHTLPDLNWAGFYFLKGGELVLGPFHGKPACVRIPLGRGVCGTAARDRKTIVVPDVEAFPGHIACDSASRSEIVVPVGDWGVLDLDSPLLRRFDDADAKCLEALVQVFIGASD
jgi:GAF domain-containing protein